MTGRVGMFCNSNSPIELEENSREPKKKKKKKKKSGLVSRRSQEGDNQNNNKNLKLILNAASDCIDRTRGLEVVGPIPRATHKPESRLSTLSRQLNYTYAKSNVILNRLKSGRRAIVAPEVVASSPDGSNEPAHCGHINSRLRQRFSKNTKANGTCDNDLCQSSCSSGSSCSRWLSAAAGTAAARPRRPEEAKGLKSAAAVGRRGRQIMIRTTNNSHTEINAHHEGILFAFPLSSRGCSSCLSSILFEALKPRQESGRFSDPAQTLPLSFQGPRGRGADEQEADEQETNEQEHELQLRLQLEPLAGQISAAASAARRHEGGRTKSVASSMIDVSATCFDVIYITACELARAPTREHEAHYEREAGEGQSSATTLTQVGVVSIVVGSLDCCCCRCSSSGSNWPASIRHEEEEQASGTSTRSSLAVPSPGSTRDSSTKLAGTTSRPSSPRVTTIETTARHRCSTIETIRCCNNASTTLDNHAPACELDDGLEQAPKSKGDLTFKLKRHDRKWLRSGTTASRLQLESLLVPLRRIVVVSTVASSSKGYKQESYDRLLVTSVPHARGPGHRAVAPPQEGPGDLMLAPSPPCGPLSGPHSNRLVTRRQSAAPSDLTSPTCNLLTGFTSGPGRAINQAADFRVAGLESQKAPPLLHELLHRRVPQLAAATFASASCGKLASGLNGANSRKRMIVQPKRLNNKNTGKPNSRATPLKLLKTTLTMLIIMLLAQWWPFEGHPSTRIRHYPARAVSCLRLRASSFSVLKGLNSQGDNNFDLYRASPRLAAASWPTPFVYHENSRASALNEQETPDSDLAKQRQRRLDKSETGSSSKTPRTKTTKTEEAEYEPEGRQEQQLFKASTGLSSSNYPATMSLTNTSKFNSLESVNVHAAQADQTPPPAHKWPVVGLVGFMFIGATGNILVCMAVLRERRLQTATNYFLLSLAIADLLVCTLVMPFGIIYEFYGRWPFDWRICNLWVTCDVLTCSSSILHMCFISVGRYLGIRNPLHARQANLFVSRRAVLWRIAIAWASSALIASPITMMSLYDHRNIVPKPHECAISNKYFMIFGSLIAFFIPMFVMVPSYVMTVRLLSRRAKFVRNDSILLANSNNNNQHRHSSSGLGAVGGSTNANQSETMAGGPTVMAGEHHQHQERSSSCFEANPQSVGQAAGGYCRAASNRSLMMSSSNETTTTSSGRLGGGAHVTRRSQRDFWTGLLSDNKNNNNNNPAFKTSNQKEVGPPNRLERVDEDAPAKAPLLAIGHDEATLKSCRYIDELDEPQAAPPPQTGGDSPPSGIESPPAPSMKTIVQREVEVEVKVATGRPKDQGRDRVKSFCTNQTPPEARTLTILGCRRCSRRRLYRRHQLASRHCCNRCCCSSVAGPQLDQALVAVGVTHNNNHRSDKQQLDDGETLTFGGGRACGKQSRASVSAPKSNNHHREPLAIANQEQRHHLSSSSLVVFCRCCKQSCSTGLTSDLTAESPTTISEISEPVAGGRAMPETLPQVSVANGKQAQEAGTTNSRQRLKHSAIMTTTTTASTTAAMDRPPPPLNQCPMAIRRPNTTRTADDRHHHRAQAADQICVCSRRCATGRPRPQADSSNELPTISTTTSNERPAALARFVAVELESGAAQVQGQGNVPRPLAGLVEATNKQQNNKPTPTNSSGNRSAPLWQSFCLKKEPPLVRDSGGLVSSGARICVATATTGQLSCLPSNQLQKAPPPPKPPRAQANGYCNWQTGDANSPDHCDKLTNKLDLPHAHHCRGSAKDGTNNKSDDLITSGGGGLVSIRIFQDEQQWPFCCSSLLGQVAKWETERAARLNKSDEFMQKRSAANISHDWNSCNDLDQFNRSLCPDCISRLAHLRQENKLRSCLVGQEQRHHHHHELIKSATTNLQQCCHFNVGDNQTNAAKALAPGGGHANSHPALQPEKLLLNHNGQQQHCKNDNCALCLLRAASSKQHLCNHHHHKHRHHGKHHHRHHHNKMSNNRDHHHHHHHGHHHDCLRRTSSGNKRKLAPDLANSDGNKAATQSNSASFNLSTAAPHAMGSVGGAWQAEEPSTIRNQSTAQEGRSSESYASSDGSARPTAPTANRVTIKTTSPVPESAEIAVSAKGDAFSAKAAGLTGRDLGPSSSSDPQVEPGDRPLEPLIAKGSPSTSAMANQPAQHNQSQSQNNSNPNHSDEPQMIRYCSSVQVRSEQKATKVLGVVFFTFVFCWTPFFMVNFISGFVKREDLTFYISDQMMTTFLWLGYISSTINPVIYTVFNGNFRRAFRRLLLCREPVGRRPYRAQSRSSDYYKSFRFSQCHRPQNHLSSRQPMSLAIQHHQQQVSAGDAGKGQANSNDPLTFGNGRLVRTRNASNNNNSCSRARHGASGSTMLTLDESSHQSPPTNADRLGRDAAPLRERTSSDDSNREQEDQRSEKAHLDRHPSTQSFAGALRDVLRNSTNVILSRASIKRAGDPSECP